VFRAILSRPDSLGIRPISFDIETYWKHDAGVFREGPELLRAVPNGEFHLRRDKRVPRRRDYEQIAIRADLQAWNSSPSFRILKETLQNWFPRA